MASDIKNIIGFIEIAKLHHNGKVMIKQLLQGQSFLKFSHIAERDPDLMAWAEYLEQQRLDGEQRRQYSATVIVLVALSAGVPFFEIIAYINSKSKGKPTLVSINKS